MYRNALDAAMARLDTGHGGQQQSCETVPRLAALSETFGPHRAIDLIWYTSWVNYMTRVADGFQLPLERENVFASPSPMPKEGKK